MLNKPFFIRRNFLLLLFNLLKCIKKSNESTIKLLNLSKVYFLENNLSKINIVLFLNFLFLIQMFFL
jgi:hypothetical protein